MLLTVLVFVVVESWTFILRLKKNTITARVNVTQDTNYISMPAELSTIVNAVGLFAVHLRTLTSRSISVTSVTSGSYNYTHNTSSSRLENGLFSSCNCDATAIRPPRDTVRRMGVARKSQGRLGVARRSQRSRVTVVTSSLVVSAVRNTDAAVISTTDKLTS